jgi:hypothetical protein
MPASSPSRVDVGRGLTADKRRETPLVEDVVASTSESCESVDELVPWGRSSSGIVVLGGGEIDTEGMRRWVVSFGGGAGGSESRRLARSGMSGK